MPRSYIFPTALAAGSVAVSFLVSSAWGGLFALISLALFAYLVLSWYRHNPIVEDWSVHNALNLRIVPPQLEMEKAFSR